jgi:hypothetical protein
VVRGIKGLIQDFVNILRRSIFLHHFEDLSADGNTILKEVLEV